MNVANIPEEEKNTILGFPANEFDAKLASNTFSKKDLSRLVTELDLDKIKDQYGVRVDSRIFKKHSSIVKGYHIRFKEGTSFRLKKRMTIDIHPVMEIPIEKWDLRGQSEGLRLILKNGELFSFQKKSYAHLGPSPEIYSLSLSSKCGNL